MEGFESAVLGIKVIQDTASGCDQHRSAMPLQNTFKGTLCREASLKNQNLSARAESVNARKSVSDP